MMSFVPNSRNSVTLKDVRQSRALILMLPILRLVLITTRHTINSFMLQADTSIYNLMYKNPIWIWFVNEAKYSEYIYIC